MDRYRDWLLSIAFVAATLATLLCFILFFANDGFSSPVLAKILFWSIGTVFGTGAGWIAERRYARSPHFHTHGRNRLFCFMLAGFFAVLVCAGVAIAAMMHNPSLRIDVGGIMFAVLAVAILGVAHEIAHRIGLRAAGQNDEEPGQ